MTDDAAALRTEIAETLADTPAHPQLDQDAAHAAAELAALGLELTPDNARAVFVTCRLLLGMHCDRDSRDADALADLRAVEYASALALR